MKRQAQTGRKYLHYKLSDKALVSRHIFKKTTLQPNNGRHILKGQKIWTKKDTPMANKHMQRCSTFAVFRKMQVKIIMRYHYTLTGMAKN